MGLPQILQQLSGQRTTQITQNIGPIKNLMNAVKTAQNPEAMLNMLANKNPQLKKAIGLINQNGGNAKETFYKLANELGVNPDDILSMLK